MTLPSKSLYNLSSLLFHAFSISIGDAQPCHLTLQDVNSAWSGRFAGYTFLPLSLIPASESGISSTSSKLVVENPETASFVHGHGEGNSSSPQPVAYPGEYNTFIYNFNSNPLDPNLRFVPAKPEQGIPAGFLASAGPQNYTKSLGLVTASCFPTEVLPEKYTVNMWCQLSVWGRLATSAPYKTFDSSIVKASHPGCENATLEVKLGSFFKRYSDGDPMDGSLFSDVTLGGTLFKAPTSAYPRSQYAYNWTAMAYFVCSRDLVLPAPFSLVWTYDNQPPWSITSNSQTDEEKGNTVVVYTSGTIVLRGTFQDFVVALNWIMWILSSLVLVVSACLCCWPWGSETVRSHSIDLLAFSGALLFAIPTMRTLWPAAPPAGTAYDIVGNYGQLLVVGCSCSLIIFRMVIYLLWPEAKSLSLRVAHSFK